MLLVIDNYDSFTYNLVQLLGGEGSELLVRRNDKVTTEEILRLKPERILLSPGPGRPEDAGVLLDVIREFAPTTPILGVCLGHQAIGMFFGGRIVHAPVLMHGRTSEIRHTGAPPFAGVKNPFTATRYHSLVISPDGFPDSLEVTATSDDGVIMGVKHKVYPTLGVQFHPESILTEEGPRMIRNWLEV